MSEVTKEEVTNLTLKRDQEVVPVVKAIIKIIAENIDSIPIGALDSEGCATKQEFADSIGKIYGEQVVPLLKESNLKLDDLAWVFTLLRQPFSEMQNVTDMSFHENKEIADALVYKVMPGEMRVMDLDRAMKENAPVDNSQTA